MCKYRFFFSIALVFWAGFLFADPSRCIKFDDVDGSGKLPFNFRIIDDRLLAGGYLFNPVTKKNSVRKVHEYLKILKTLGASSIVLLHVPAAGDKFTQELEKACREESLELYKLRMNSEKVPNADETARLMKLIDGGAYVHCMWGCDRTGAVIAKYLVDRKGYTSEQAFKAIIGGGSHAGKKGGFKKTPGNRNLLLYFWPNVQTEAPEVWKYYSK
ncbi:MAG: hypothetical protein Kow0029_16720 [Candidatus Rifleibacteriota bacterium]